MKRFFGVLILLNIGLYAYFNLGLLLPGKPEIKLVEINADKITLLSQAQIEALPKKAAPVAAPPAAEPEAVAMCYEWGIFSDASLAKAQKSISRISLQATAKSVNPNQPKRYWVYKPPLKTAAEAQKKAAEYKELGVQDLFVVQEEKWKNAISFGIFEDEQLADKLIQELKAKGVKNIEKSLRSNGKDQYSLVFRKPNQNDIATLNKLKPDFPTAELKEIACQ